MDFANQNDIAIFTTKTTMVGSNVSKLDISVIDFAIISFLGSRRLSKAVSRIFNAYSVDRAPKICRK